MTLVLPYCGEQSDTRLFFEPIRSKMPCVYEGQPLDFESALMSGEWPTLKDIASEYEQSDDSTKATPASSGDRSPSKRKLISESSCESDVSDAKKPCTDTFLSPPFAATTSDSAPSSSSCLVQEAAEEEEEQYPPRRRGPQMWNSRQRWKDERKKVLKMSVAKLSDIEDPELWLLRSVLINNTIKRLHNEIRNERQAKVRHRQQKVDFYHERYEPPSPFCFESKKAASPPTPDFYDDSSCDEIFGISEDFLRVTIPDRRMSSSPIPSNLGQDVDKDSRMDIDPPPTSSPACDATSRCERPAAAALATARLPASGPPQRCATQFRTNEGDATFPPRVPILDSVVYHSLLASLESS